MILVDVYHDGTLVRKLIHEIQSAMLQMTVNQADVLSLVLEDDLVELENDLVFYSDEHRIGRFTVQTVEISYTSEGGMLCKISAVPTATYWLARTGTPTSDFFDAITATAALAMIRDEVSRTNGRAVTFTPVNAIGLDRPVKNADTATMLEAMGALVMPSNSRWRCRPDLDDLTIEVGQFGAITNVVIRPASKALVETPLPNLYLATTLTGRRSNEDTFNCAVVEGGQWTDSEQYTSSLQLWWDSIVPTGFVLSTDYYFRLDTAGVAQRHRTSRRIVFAGIVPQATGEFPPSGEQVEAASQFLMNAGADRLKETVLDKRTWQGVVSHLIPDLRPGDKVNLTTLKRNGSVQDTGYFYVTSLTVNWRDDGGVASSLEMSNVLESMLDPLSKEFKPKITERQHRWFPLFYNEIVCAPTGTLKLHTVWTLPPIVHSLTSLTPGATPYLISITQREVVVGVTGVAPATVRIAIIPRLI